MRVQMTDESAQRERFLEIEESARMANLAVRDLAQRLRDSRQELQRQQAHAADASDPLSMARMERSARTGAEAARARKLQFEGVERATAEVERLEKLHDSAEVKNKALSQLTGACRDHLARLNISLDRPSFSDATANLGAA